MICIYEPHSQSQKYFVVNISKICRLTPDSNILQGLYQLTMSECRSLDGLRVLTWLLAAAAVFPRIAAGSIVANGTYSHYESSLWATPSMNLEKYACLWEKGFVTHVIDDIKD